MSAYSLPTEMETYKKQANRYQYFCFCSTTVLTSKIITEMIDNHYEFSCCVNSSTINLFQFYLDKP